jgi:hypothetical protein
MDGKLLKNYTKACRSCFFVNFEGKKTPLSSYLGLVGGMKEKGEKIIFFSLFFSYFL